MLASTETWENPLLRLALAGNQPLPLDHAAEYEAEHLEQAYAHCAELTRFHSQSFYVATQLLPLPKRQATRALYAFCRVTDEIVDNASGDAAADLAAWRQEALSGRPAGHDQVILAWTTTRAQYGIPRKYAEQLIDGCAQDLTKNRYANFNELADYCYRVASTVGLMSMHIIGFQGEEAIRYAIKLGVALQLTNILRDIDEDWARGRLYLPQDELASFGLSEADIAAGRHDERWREFMRFQIERTRRIYDEAWPGIALLDSDGRFATAAAATFYQEILSDIERHDYNIFGRRAFVPKWQKIRQLPQLWWQTRSMEPQTISA